MTKIKLNKQYEYYSTITGTYTVLDEGTEGFVVDVQDDKPVVEIDGINLPFHGISWEYLEKQ